MIETVRILAWALWPALSAAAATGFVVGLATCAEAGSGRGGRIAFASAVLAAGAGVAASVLALLPGRPGLWLDIALALGAGYVLGCILGCVARRALGFAAGTVPAKTSVE